MWAEYAAEKYQEQLVYGPRHTPVSMFVDASLENSRLIVRKMLAQVHESNRTV